MWNSNIENHAGLKVFQAPVRQRCVEVVAVCVSSGVGEFILLCMQLTQSLL